LVAVAVAAAGLPGCGQQHQIDMQGSPLPGNSFLIDLLQQQPIPFLIITPPPLLDSAACLDLTAVYLWFAAA